MAVFTAVTVSACTSAGGQGLPATATGSTGTTVAAAGAESIATIPTEPGGVPAADLAAIRAAIDAINATAGGPVSAQRAELDALVIPAEASKQRSCPAARSTLAFQPAYADLRLAPFRSAGGSGSESDGDSTGTAGSAPAAVTRSASPAPGPSGTAYLLPAFITIYTGDRITGTDLTTLRLWVTAGGARTGALCVS